MRGRPQIAGLGLALVGACVPVGREIELPIHDGVETQIAILRSTGGAVIDAWVLDRSDDVLSLSRSGGAELVVLVYERDREALVLDRGPLLLRTGDEGRQIPDRPDAVFVRQLGVDESWRTLEAMPEDIRELRLTDRARTNPCRALSARSIRLPGTDHGIGRVIAPIDEQTVFVGADKGRYFQYDPGSDDVEVLALDAPLPPIRDGIRGADGAIWMLAEPGAGETQLIRVDPDGWTVTSTRVPHVLREPREEMAVPLGTRTNPGYAWIRGPSPGEGPLELFVMTADGWLGHLDEDGWQTVAEARARKDILWGGSMEWLGPQEILAMGPRHPDVLHANLQTEQYDWLALPQSAGVPTTLVKTDFGPVVGTLDDQLYVLEEGRFREIHAGAGPVISEMAPLGAGLLFGGIGGSVTQLQPRHGTCGEAQRLAFGNISVMREVGDQILMMSDEWGELVALTFE